MAKNDREFGVRACRDFLAGEYVYELAGLVPTDSSADHAGLSAIMTHVDQGETLESRVLFGPIRFVNHHCTASNVQVCKCHSTLPTSRLNFTVCPTA
jgi:hypothetical protein